MKRSSVHGLLALVATIWGATALIATAHDSTAATTVTNVTGTITQLNYDENGTVQSFLIGTKVLLSFPSAICGGIATLGVVGNSVTYSGTAFTATSGFEAVSVTSFTNTTTSATYTLPSSKSTAYGPTSGTVTQLNYGNNGAIDGFIFIPSGTTTHLFVATGPRPSATLTSLLMVDATVSVTGETSSRLSACASTATLETVNAPSLTIAGTTITLSGGGGNPFHH